MTKTSVTEPVVIALLTILLVSVPMLATFAKAGTAAKADPIKIGLILEFSGPMANYGPELKKAIEMRFEEVNYQVAGKPIEIIIEDSATDTSVTLEKVKKLVEQDKVKIIIGPVHGSLINAVGPYLAQNKILSICIKKLNIETKTFGNFIVHNGTSWTIGLPLGWYGYETLGYRTATILGADYIAGKRFVGGAAAGFKEKGGKVIQEQWAPTGTLDFAPYISNLKKADVFIVWTMHADLLRLLKQYDKYGMKMPLLIPNACLPQSYMEGVGESLLGAIGCTSYSWLIDTPANKKFVAAFEKKFKEKPDDDHYCAYTSVSLTLAGLEATKGDTTFEKLHSAILGLKMESLEGTMMFDPSGFSLVNRFIVKASLENGVYAWKPIYTYPNFRDPRL